MNQNMKIWILQTAEPVHSDLGSPRPMRAMNLANKLIENQFKVRIWTSDFLHQEKRHRTKTFSEYQISRNLTINLIPSKGYEKHISINRLHDHFILSRNLKKALLKITELPDLVFIGYPPIETAYVMMKWLKKRNIPYVLDVKDQWPVIFYQRMNFFIKPFAFFMSLPYISVSKSIFKNAIAISSISDGFLNWSIDYGNRIRTEIDLVTPLTSPTIIYNEHEIKESINWWVDQGVKVNKNFKIIFVGSMSKVFNFDVIFDACNLLDDKKMAYEFIICGDGELRPYILLKAKQYPRVKVIKWINHKKMFTLSKIASAYIAPYNNTPDFKISIPNKIIDACKFGLPILTSLEGDVSNLINSKKIGMTFNDGRSLSESIEELIGNQKKYEIFSENSINTYRKLFDSNIVYQECVKNLNKIINGDKRVN